MGRIRYGVKNVHYAIATDDGSGALTYDDPIAIPGAKSITLDAQGENVDEYADNTVWWHGVTNNGYSGTLEFEDTAAADAFLTSVLGQTKATATGVVTEKATDVQKEFALGFQFELGGDTATGKRTWMYRCTAARPSVSGSTKESSVAVQTNSVAITALPRLSDDAVKASCDSTSSAYADWFEEVG